MKRNWNNLFKISNLLVKRLTGQISPEENHGLHQSLDEAGSNIDYTYIHKKITDKPVFDAKEGFFHFKKHTNTRVYSFERLLKVAAAVLIPLLVVYGVYEFSYDNKIDVVRAENISPGEPRAYLQLSNGEQIILEKSDSAAINEQHGIVLKSQKGSLIYQNGLKVFDENVDKLFNEIVVPRGAEFNVMLADGTVIHLNADSRLRYPVVFDKESRQVTISGEAFFDVAHDKSRPFKVKTSLGEIVVTGTSFNVRDYFNEHEVVTTLVDGGVTYHPRMTSVNAIDLKPNYQIIHQSDNNNIESRLVNVDEFIGWKSGNYIFNEKPLELIMRDIERWYDVKVHFENDKLKDLTLTGNLLKYKELNRFLKVLQSTDELTYEIRNKDIYLN